MKIVLTVIGIGAVVSYLFGLYRSRGGGDDGALRAVVPVLIAFVLACAEVALAVDWLVWRLAHG